MLSYFSCVWLFATLWTVARQALCPWWFSRWEYWSGLWGDIPDPGIKFTSGLVLLFSHSVMSDSLRPHGLQHARLPCPSLSPRVCSDSCPLSRWCYLTISTSASPFSCYLQSFPASGSFPMSQFFTSGGKVLEHQLQHQSFQWIFRVDFFRIDWFDLLAVQ